MALGIDTASRLDKKMPHWNTFLTNWPQQPEYVGRYFGSLQPDVPSQNAWVPGELSTLKLTAPLAQGIRYIMVFTPPGPLSTNRPAALSQHGQQNRPVFFRQQGQSRDSAVPLQASRVRGHGREDAKSTGEQIADALNFIDPITGQPELLLPDSEELFVFLDVEPQTTLSSHYWLGWAETISSFMITKKTTIGTVALVQPMRPCLYCVVREDRVAGRDPWNERGQPAPFPLDEPGPWPEITGAFRETGFIPVRIRGKHSCHALATPWPFDSFDVNAAIQATDAQVQSEFLTYGNLQQPIGPEAPVVLWQYKINIGMDAAGNFFDPDAVGSPSPVFDIDLNVTRSAPINGRPITDFMLRVNRP